MLLKKLKWVKLNFLKGFESLRFKKKNGV